MASRLAAADKWQNVSRDHFGITDLFERTLSLHLETMHPVEATHEAMRAVQRYLDSSKFVDLSGKGEAPQFLRMDRDRDKESSAGKVISGDRGRKM